MMSPSVIVSTGCTWESWITNRPTWRWAGTWNRWYTRHRPRLQGRGRRDDLVHGPGLERVGQRPIAAGPRIGLAGREVVGIEPGIGRHRVDVAGGGVHHDHGAALGAVGTDRTFEVGLHLVLHLAVDRRHEVHTGDRLPERVGPRGDREAGGGVLLRLLTRDPAQRGVVLRLEAGQAVPVDAHEAEHLRRERARGVVALRHREQIDPGQAEVGHLLREVGIHLPGDEGEGAGRGEGGHERLRLDAQERCDLRGLAIRIGHVGGVHVDVARVEGDGERRLLTVEDLSALGWERDRALALVETEGRVLPLICDLQEGEAHDDPREQEQHDREERHEPLQGRPRHP